MQIDSDWCRLMLIDDEWCWLMLIDADWCRLMLIDADWCWSNEVQPGSLSPVIFQLCLSIDMAVGPNSKAGPTHVLELGIQWQAWKQKFFFCEENAYKSGVGLWARHLLLFLSSACCHLCHHLLQAVLLWVTILVQFLCLCQDKVAYDDKERCGMNIKEPADWSALATASAVHWPHFKLLHNSFYLNLSFQNIWLKCIFNKFNNFNK